MCTRQPQAPVCPSPLPFPTGNHNFILSEFISQWAFFFFVCEFICITF